METLTVGTRTDRMEIVFDACHVTEEVSGREVLRLRKHQVLMRLGHPIMRQAMATLSRQLHQPEGGNAVYRWSVAALPKSASFEALLPTANRPTRRQPRGPAAGRTPLTVSPLARTRMGTHHATPCHRRAPAAEAGRVA
jgi:hypothetical protein